MTPAILLCCFVLQTLILESLDRPILHFPDVYFENEKYGLKLGLTCPSKETTYLKRLGAAENHFGWCRMASDIFVIISKALNCVI